MAYTQNDYFVSIQMLFEIAVENGWSFDYLQLQTEDALEEFLEENGYYGEGG